MIRFVLSFACFFICSMVTQAQTEWMKSLREDVRKIKKENTDTVTELWKRGLHFNLNINQGSLSNWAAGGDNFSLALGSNVHAWVFYKNGRRSWDNVADLSYGYLNTTSLGGRKNDDRIDLSTKYGYYVGRKWYVSGLINLRTQFTAGYLYPADTTPQLSSRFFAPAYLLISPGFDYKPDATFSLFLSPVTTRLLFVIDPYLSSQAAYGVDSGRHFKYEYGAYLSANYIKTIGANITYKGKLDLFSNYLVNPQNIIVLMNNTMELKVNKWISTLLTIDMIYDDNVKVFTNKVTGIKGPRLQLKQVIGVGFSAKF